MSSHDTGVRRLPVARDALDEELISGRATLTAPLSVGGPEPRVRSRGWLLTEALPLAAIIAVAAFARLWQLGAVGFNGDEAVYTGSAASLAGNHSLGTLFPVFRAHPLLFQTLLSVVLRVHDTDWMARAFAAGIGVLTVAVTFAVGRRLYGRNAGLLAALILAVMPYHVIVSRQVLLDGLMTLCATAALYCTARYVEERSARWMLAVGGMMGVAILAKETSVVLLGSLYVFFALVPSIRVRGRHLLLALVTVIAEVATWPLALRLAGHQSTGQSFLLWQLFRRANHSLWFYFSSLPSWIGMAVLIAALAGLVWPWRERSGRETLLLAWIVVPAAFFTAWPTKGFEYLLPVAPPLAVLAGRALSRPLVAARPRWLTRTHWLPRAAMATLALVTVVSLGAATWVRIEPSTSGSFLAGTGGLVGGRQAGDWVRQHVPAGARLLAIGPSLANVLEFYGRRPVSALSISTDPHDRNPVYTPVPNPDLALRRGDFQYIVWDSYTAARSPFFSRDALRLVRKYSGVAVFTATVTARSATGSSVTKPVIIVYEVHP